MPQIIGFQTPPDQLNDHIEQAIVLLDAHELTPDERAGLLPIVVTLLANKPVGIVPDGPQIDLSALNLGRH